MVSYIHLIRHGITDGILNKRFYGWRDLPVVEKGFRELEKFKTQGIYPKVDDKTYFVTSGMLRANQTLETIYGKVDFEVNEKIKEINFGDWEMKTYHELEQDELWDKWMTDTTGEFRFPGGDSMISFHERIGEGMGEILKGHMEREEDMTIKAGNVTVVVCHGGTIASAMTTWFPGLREYFMNWTPNPGRGYTVTIEDGKPIRYTEI